MSELLRKSGDPATDPDAATDPGTATDPDAGTDPDGPPATQPRASKPVVVWATVGAAVVLFQAYVWIRWVTGPYFERVAEGPSEPPTYMKVPLVANMVFLWVTIPFVLWFLVVRPLLRERRIPLDGMLLGGMGLMFFQDPLLNYVNTWCTYNTWLFNRGAWTSNIPGWVSPEEPGRQVPEPLLTNAPGYMWGVLLCTMIICLAMRRIRARWPGISNLRLIGITYAIAFAFDFVMEALVLLPIGFYSYPGAIRAVSFNAGTYYQWPVYEGLMWGAVQTSLCCLRFFTDDRGRTVVERGLDEIRGGAVQRQVVRFLAIVAACGASFFVFYNVPVQWLALHADPWPTDVQERSYLNGGICGDGTDVPCPDPDLPLPTKRSGYIGYDGKLVLPDGARLPTPVPFVQGK